MSLICCRICLSNGEIACSCSYLFSKLKLFFLYFIVFPFYIKKKKKLQQCKVNKIV